MILSHFYEALFMIILHFYEGVYAFILHFYEGVTTSLALETPLTV